MVLLYFLLKDSYQITSIFYIYINMNERVDVKQDVSSLIIEPLLPPHDFIVLSLLYICLKGYEVFMN